MIKKLNVKIQYFFLSTVNFFHHQRMKELVNCTYMGERVEEHIFGCLNVCENLCSKGEKTMAWNCIVNLGITFYNYMLWKHVPPPSV